jgi:predicted deacetylase
MSSGALYILRLDDACPTMDGARWKALESVLAHHDVKPIVAIVPENADPDLVRGSVDSAFWDRARSWVRNGWTIALHGYRHQLHKTRGGLVPVSRHAEFTGLPWAEQRHRIREGFRILEGRGLHPWVWVAPSHGFDLATLQALREETDIRTISDGFSCRAFHRLGFTWLPQQLWRPREMIAGLWTICLHPNHLDDASLRRLEGFIAGHPKSFPLAAEASARAVPFGGMDMVFGAAFAGIVRVKKMFSGRMGNGRT